MMEEGLKIKVGADVTGVEAGMKKAVKSIGVLERQLKVFQSSLKNATDPSRIATLNRAIDATNSRISSLKGLQNPFTTLNRGAGQSQQVMIDLGRIIQDIPYGIRGVANNIDPFIGSIGRLKTATGGYGAVAAALGKSLLGPAGIAIAVSTVTSLLVSNSFSLFSASKGVNLYKGAIEEASKAVGEQLVKLSIYRTKLNDVSLSIGERTKVAKEYNKTAEETNKIDLKQLNNLDLINRKIDEQNTLILRRALSLAAISKLSEKANKLIELELQFQAEIDKRGLKEADVVKIGKDRVKQAEAEKKAREGVNAVIRDGLDGVINYSKNAAKQATVTEDALLSMFDSLSKARGELKKDVGSLSGFISVDGLTTSDGGGGKKDGKDFKFLEQFFGFNPNGKLTPKQEHELLQAADNFYKKFGEAFEVPNFLIQNLPLEVAKKFNEQWEKGDFKLKFKAEIDFSQVPTIAPKDDNRELFIRGEQQRVFADDEGLSLPTGEELEILKKKFFDLRNVGEENMKRLGLIVADTITPAFQSLIDTILSGGDVMKTFFSTLGESLKRLVGQLIQAAIQAAILSALFPGGLGGVKGFAGFFGSALGLGTGGTASPGNRFGFENIAGLRNINLNTSRVNFSGAANRMGRNSNGGINVTVTGQLVGQGSQLRAVINNANTLSGIIK